MTHRIIRQLRPVVLALMGVAISQINTPGHRAAAGPVVRPAQANAATTWPPIQVGPNVQVSADNANVSHYEVISCTNPVDPGQMLAGVMTFQNGIDRTILYRSTDGGDHWSQALAAREGSGDPTCVFSADGSAYFAVLVMEGGRSQLLLYRSGDGGTTWGPPIEQPAADRPYLIMDDTRGPFHGSLYTVGVASTRSLESRGTVSVGTDPGFMTGPALFASRDNGRTFIGRMRVATSPRYAIGLSSPVVLADGSVTALLGVERDHVTPFNIDRRPARSLTAVRSTPGGTAIRESVHVSDWYLDSARNDGTNIPALALDRTHGLFDGRLYAVWADNRSGRSQVLLSWSDSNGDSWSAPVVVDDDLSKMDPNQLPDAINVSVAVNQAGVLGVAWADRREQTDNRGWRYRFAASFDGGDTFTPSVKLASSMNSYDGRQSYPFLTLIPSRSPGPRQPLLIRVSVMRFFYSSGDTVSMTIDEAGRFHPMWCDNRTGLSQLWTAPVVVSRLAVRNGNEHLTDLDDITHRVEAIVETIKYDPGSNRGELTVRIKNVSSDVIAGPLRARVLGLSGQLGVPALVSEGHDRPDVLTFEIDRLRPNELSSAQTIRFLIASHHPPVSGHDFVPAQWPFLNIRLKVFAGRTDNK